MNCDDLVEGTKHLCEAIGLPFAELKVDIAKDDEALRIIVFHPEFAEMGALATIPLAPEDDAFAMLVAVQSHFALSAIVGITRDAIAEAAV